MTASTTSMRSNRGRRRPSRPECGGGQSMDWDIAKLHSYQLLFFTSFISYSDDPPTLRQRRYPYPWMSSGRTRRGCSLSCLYITFRIWAADQILSQSLHLCRSVFDLFGILLTMSWEKSAVFLQQQPKNRIDGADIGTHRTGECRRQSFELQIPYD